MGRRLREAPGALQRPFSFQAAGLIRQEPGLCLGGLRSCVRGQLLAATQLPAQLPVADAARRDWRPAAELRCARFLLICRPPPPAKWTSNEARRAPQAPAYAMQKAVELLGGRVCWR